MHHVLGHYFTIAPWLRHRLGTPGEIPGTRWETSLVDPKVGRVRLSGVLSEEPDADTVLVVVHGLGGGIHSHYVYRAALAAEAAKMACLRLSLRGADRRGEDFYHAGLTADLHAAMASRGLERYRRIFLLGYSLGGHVVLRYATESFDPRIGAVAAVCAPLDLERSAQAIDRFASLVYRRYLLHTLREIYEKVAELRAVPIPVRQARRVRTLREWDTKTVAPRHGFESAEHYYAEMSVAPLLRKIAIPALLVYAEKDPMVPAEIVRPCLEGLPPNVEVRWVERGGHVGFPAKLDPGQRAPRGLASQIIGWLETHR